MGSVVTFIVSLLVLAAAASGSPPSAPSSPPPAPAAGADTPGATEFDAAHAGHVLCIHENVPPVAVYFLHYTDPMGSHFHGFIPPMGAPFFVQCFDGSVYLR